MLISLENHQLIKISGPDSAKYLQGQLTCDVNKLELNTSTLMAHCDAKGKVMSLSRLYRQEENCFYVLVRKNILEVSLSHLKKYAVFSKVEFEVLDWQIVGAIDEQIEITCDENSLLINVADNRQILCAEHIHLQNLEMNFKLWDLADIKAGIPILSKENVDEFIPQALNLQAIGDTISFKKGCYIGQEIIARAKYRGINKRAMFVFSAKTSEIPEVGGGIEIQLENGWRKTGAILAVVQDNETLWLEVVLNKTEEQSCYRLQNSEIQLIPYSLPYELS